MYDVRGRMTMEEARAFQADVLNIVSQIPRGKVKVSTYDDEGNVKEDIILCPEDGKYGVDINKNVWHSLESLESGSVIFECKEGPFVPHEVDGILEVKK